MLKFIVSSATLLLVTGSIYSTEAAANNSSKPLYPVIIVPGLIGSRLEAKLDRKDVDHFYCQRQSSDWYDLWLGATDVLPFGVTCLEDNMRLIYNSTSRRTRNPAGVSIRAASFGKCDSVDYLNSLMLPGTNYMITLTNRLTEIGYECEKNIMSAPYDFRKAVNEFEDYFEDTRKLVESASAKNNNQRVVFICHSNGCLNNIYFLSKQSKAWKDKYVRSVITLGSVWGGAVKALILYTFGMRVGPFVDGGVVRRIFRTFPSVASLVPSVESFDPEAVIMRNGNQNYTVLDYKKFFEDLSHPDGYQMWLDLRNLTSPLSVPNVDLHCLHSYNESTMEQFIWRSGGFPDETPEIIWGDGDGTVNLASLQACQKYKQLQKEPFHYKTFPSINHQAMVDDPGVFEYIKAVLFDQSEA